MRILLSLTVVSLCLTWVTSLAAPAIASQVDTPYIALVNVNTGMCLTVAAEAGDANGASVIQLPCTNPLSDAQLWYLQRFANGDGQLVNLLHEKCLDVPAADVFMNGTKLWVWDCMGPRQLNQLWSIQVIYGSSDTYPARAFVSRASGKCIDVPAEFKNDVGAQIQQWDCYGAQQWNQLWRLHYGPLPENFAYPIPSIRIPSPRYASIYVCDRKSQSGKCIDLYLTNGGLVDIAPRSPFNNAISSFVLYAPENVEIVLMDQLTPDLKVLGQLCRWRGNGGELRISEDELNACNINNKTSAISWLVDERLSDRVRYEVN